MTSSSKLKLVDNISDFPSSFEVKQLFGHNKIKEQLLNRFVNISSSSALLFEGISGVGKAGIAFQLAWNLIDNSLQQWKDIDFSAPLYEQMVTNSCASFLYVARRYEKKQDNFQQSISIDDIRKITSFLQKTNQSSGWRIILIDSINSLNYAAENALLKILEEPPQKSLFILISHGKSGALDTTKSRCQRFLFQPLSNDDLLKAVEQLNCYDFLSLDQLERNKMLELASGSMRDLLLFSCYGGGEIIKEIDDILQSDNFVTSKAMSISVALSHKDAQSQYNLLFSYLLQIIHQHAKKFAIEGNSQQAKRFSDFWFEFKNKISQTDIYNLDKKQTIFLALNEVHKIFYPKQNYC